MQKEVETKRIPKKPIKITLNCKKIHKSFLLHCFWRSNAKSEMMGGGCYINPEHIIALSVGVKDSPGKRLKARFHEHWLYRFENTFVLKETIDVSENCTHLHKPCRHSQQGPSAASSCLRGLNEAVQMRRGQTCSSATPTHTRIISTLLLSQCQHDGKEGENIHTFLLKQ